MTSEQLLELMSYLPDEAILRADPANYPIKQRSKHRRILTVGSIAAAVVLCVTVGWMRFFPTQPDGDPSVQLPPTVTITDTDTDTQTTTNDTSSSTEDGINTPGAAPAPHFHYQGRGYYPNGKMIILRDLPENTYYIGECITFMGCLSGANHNRNDLYGNLIGSLYLSEDQTAGYHLFRQDSDGTKYYQKLVYVEGE